MLAGKRSRAVRWKRQQNAVASKPRFISNDRSVDSLDASICAEIRTKIPDTIAWDYNFEPAGANPLTFTVKIDFMYYVNSELLVAFQCDH
ncbi:uncharacterized protein LOC114371987 [Glycine soja]|uniref:uncharacterized protein LOC114371987 n=1 Tax=Glycine soja TaxID=3848 RepID=UPI000E21BA6E|nr:uncharacterized protein LOC114371987 [Glycine soja]|eukprot:XP_025979893.1 uncharacterized protein LOC112998145 isoform X2 [Glycine max]